MPRQQRNRSDRSASRSPGRISINGTIEVLPATLYPGVRLVEVPAPPDLAFPSSSEILGHRWRQLRPPFVNRLTTEHEASHEEQLCEVPQAELEISWDSPNSPLHVLSNPTRLALSKCDLSDPQSAFCDTRWKGVFKSLLMDRDDM